MNEYVALRVYYIYIQHYRFLVYFICGSVLHATEIFLLHYLQIHFCYHKQRCFFNNININIWQYYYSKLIFEVKLKTM